MTAPDVINGAFELLGGLTTGLNIRALMRDKQVRGVDWRLTFFYTAWGLWNLFYYPHLGQWASFAGGVVIVAGNLVWLALVIHYRRRSAIFEAATRGRDDPRRSPLYVANRKRGSE